MKNILFVGRFFSPKILERLNKYGKGFPGYSTHNFEIAAIRGLHGNKDINLKTITCPTIYSYPHNNSKLFTPSEKFDIDGVEGYSIGFCNLVILNRIWAFISTFYHIIKALNKFKGEEVTIICNLASSATAVELARKMIPSKIKVTYMILDIPQMVSNMSHMNPLKSFLIRHMDGDKIKFASNSDGLILVTEQMMDFINRPVKHIVIEGWVDPKVNALQPKSDNERKAFLYTGTLRKIFGVMNLIYAFQNIKDPDVELWLCGSGDAEPEIREYAIKDKRIKFYGLVSSDRARELQSEATILINPRTSEGEYTKYSFPSKTLEYLLSGKPSIVYRLPGMPDEYLDFLFIPNSESVEALSAKMTEVLEMDPIDRAAFGARGRKFVLKHKTPEIQMAKVYKMICSYE